VWGAGAQGRNYKNGKKAIGCQFASFLQDSSRMHAPITVVLETSTPQGSVGLWSGTWQEMSFFSERSHNCAVFAPLQQLLATLHGKRIETILVGTGPGSYSGTRVGIAVAQGLAIAHCAQLIGLPSILATPMARAEPRCRAIGDARRGDWWWYEIHQGTCSPSPQMGSKEDLLEVLNDSIPTSSLEPIPDDALGIKVAQEIPSSGMLWQAWQALSAEQRDLWSKQIVQPVYLKPPHITQAKPGHPLLRGR
jgi:tRNA threonylcarbamoyladenosine biosynthesis protein TsaB